METSLFTISYEHKFMILTLFSLHTHTHTAGGTMGPSPEQRQRQFWPANETLVSWSGTARVVAQTTLSLSGQATPFSPYYSSTIVMCL